MTETVEAKKEALEEVEAKVLVARMVKAKEKMKALKAEYDEAAAELQRRAMQEMEDHNVKFVRFRGTRGTVMITEKGSLQLVNAVGLKKCIGEELFDSQTNTTHSVNYKLKAAFENALKSIFLGDYDFSLALEEVFDTLGADTDQRKILKKKLKGVYDKDSDLLTSMFGEKNYETELWCIYKIKNAQRIRTFFPDATEEDLESICKHVVVEESLSVGLTE